MPRRRLSPEERFNRDQMRLYRETLAAQERMQARHNRANVFMSWAQSLAFNRPMQVAGMLGTVAVAKAVSKALAAKGGPRERFEVVAGTLADGVQGLALTAGGVAYLGNADGGAAATFDIPDVEAPKPQGVALPGQGGGFPFLLPPILPLPPVEPRPEPRPEPRREPDSTRDPRPDNTRDPRQDTHDRNVRDPREEPRGDVIDRPGDVPDSDSDGFPRDFPKGFFDERELREPDSRGGAGEELPVPAQDRRRAPGPQREPEPFLRLPAAGAIAHPFNPPATRRPAPGEPGGPPLRTPTGFTASEAIGALAAPVGLAARGGAALVRAARPLARAAGAAARRAATIAPGVGAGGRAAAEPARRPEQMTSIEARRRAAARPPPRPPPGALP